MWWGNQVPVCFSFSYLINRHLDIEEQSEPQVNERTLVMKLIGSPCSSVI